MGAPYAAGSAESKVAIVLNVSVCSLSDESRGVQLKVISGTWKTKMWYCQCDNKDGCNGSANRRFSLMTITLGLALVLWPWASSDA